MSNSFMDKLRSFLGFRHEPPRNDFRNPIWGSDDDDDGDELYSRHQSTIYTDPLDVHRQFAEQMQKMFETFGSMFGDFKTFFPDDGHFDSFASITEVPSEPDTYESHNNNIRDYYLKPGYQNQRHELDREDVDLDGKISSHEISGLLKQKDDKPDSISPFSGNLVPKQSFCQTVITTSISKPDGTVETKRIVKNGNEVIEETTTTSSPSTPFHPGSESISSTGFMYNSLLDFMFKSRNFN